MTANEVGLCEVEIFLNEVKKGFQFHKAQVVRSTGVAVLCATWA
jgi:hypothetical protein